jgi:glycosyltransferase involved in cell wall biosynthesis
LKILGVIDSFGSGGAQRQFVELVCGLKARGHEAEVFVYHPESDFHREQVDLAGITVHECQKYSRFSLAVPFKLHQLISNSEFDIVVSFLDTPNIYSEFVNLVSISDTIHVASERASRHLDNSIVFPWLKRSLHRFADHLVTNSHSHAEWLVGNHGWLEGKVSCIYNGVDLELFTCQPGPLSRNLIAIGRVSPEKNVMRLVEALELFNRRNGWAPTLEWIGRFENSTEGAAYQCALEQRLANNTLDWRWLGEQKDIPSYLERSYALVLPSLHEGLPNVVCEALAAGRPAVVSAVCDNGYLVEEDERGFLFFPQDELSICSALEKLYGLGDEEWLRIGKRCRKYAEANLGLSRMVSKYESLFLSLMAERLSR